MSKLPPWQLVLRGYRKSKEPAVRGRCQIWQASIGLQGVDGLNPSDYLVKLATKHIEGSIKFPELEKSLYRYYKWHKFSRELTEETWEADLVSVHIAELLMDRSFRLDLQEIKKIHHHLFKDVFSFAGDFRDYNIRKKEWVLDGNSVSYEDCDTIKATLESLFSDEKAFSYQNISQETLIRHMARFISALWLSHPYGEGNTRTTSVFLIRYLQSLGLRMKRDVFMDAWYFRNTLVRANYQDPENDVYADYSYLENFLQNLLLGTNHPLRNHELHIRYPNI